MYKARFFMVSKRNLDKKSRDIEFRKNFLESGKMNDFSYSEDEES